MRRPLAAALVSGCCLCLLSDPATAATRTLKAGQMLGVSGDLVIRTNRKRSTSRHWTPKRPTGGRNIERRWTATGRPTREVLAAEIGQE